GADGFIGRQAILSLLAKSYEVHAVSNVEPPEDLRLENVRWHKTNLLDAYETAELTKNVEASHLLHFAWFVEHGEFWSSPKNKIWVKASLDLLANFQKNGGKRVVISGTCAEYEFGIDDLLTEDSTPLKPQTLYGQSKLELQQKLAETDLDWAWGRIFFLYGENESPKRLVSSVIKSLLKDELADCSHGNQIRDFMYVGDVADAFAAVLDSDVKGCVNIASGKPTTIKELILLIADMLEKPQNIRFGKVPTSKDEPERIVASVKKLSNELKWIPSKSLSQGIEQTINWWKKQITE
ncbi:MAG: NAD-dependent epimerase/dehydratase family protein, partial [Pyrinomonadaceae bacterium]